MPDLDHLPIEINDWKGLFTRGSSDNTPPGFLIDTLNTRYTGSDVISRDGSTVELSNAGAGPWTRFFAYKKLTSSRMLILRIDIGVIYDSTALGFDILGGVGYAPISDFSMINYNNRAYITTHNRVQGDTGKSLLVYDDINIGPLARLAAGAPPTGYTVAAVESAVAGNCEAGVHLIAIVNIYDTGYITQPGPNIVAVTSTGGFAIDVGNIDAGPSGTIARGVVATKAIQNYNGDPNSYEFFQVSSANGGLINNNLNNEVTSLSFFDSELVVSVDYLFDNRQTIPAGLGLCEYRGRLVIWGFPDDPHSIYLSKPYAPEEFDSVGGIITVDPFESHSIVSNCFVFRGSLIICKNNRLYQTTDNGDDPVNWQVDMIDNGVGTTCFGVASIIDSKGQENDRTFIADRSGLIIFEGYVRRPECTWLVEDTWKRINKASFNLIQVCSDPITSSIYITLPLDGSTFVNYILFGYYGSAFVDGGFDPKLIKWSIWQFAQGFNSILIDIDSTTAEPVLKYSGFSGIYNVKQDGLVHSDDSVAFISYVTTALYTSKSKWINHFGGIALKVDGSGTLHSVLYGEDIVTTSGLLANITLADPSGREYFLLANFKNEKSAVQLYVTEATDYFQLTKLILYAKPLWLNRPM